MKAVALTHYLPIDDPQSLLDIELDAPPGPMREQDHDCGIGKAAVELYERELPSDAHAKRPYRRQTVFEVPNDPVVGRPRRTNRRNEVVTLAFLQVPIVVD